MSSGPKLRDTRAELQLDARVLIESGLLEKGAFELEFTGKQLLRQRRSLIGEVRLGADQDDPAREALLRKASAPWAPA